MRFAALGCALAAIALVIPSVGASQTPSPQPSALAVPVDGPTPDTAATPCPGETAALPSVVHPASIAISPESRANFSAHNQDGHGSFLVLMRQDGQSATVIPPTRDIDDALRTQLLAFGHGTTINAPIAGCPRWAALVVVAFNPNDGAVRVSVLPPGPKPMPTSLSIEDYQRADAIVHPVPVFVGPTPLFGGTPCPGETERRGMIVPRTIAISPESARFFRANNAVSQIRFVLTLRLDGQAALSLPRQLVIDDALRAALVSATQKIALRPPIEGCARPAGAFIGMVSVPDGTFDLRQVPPKP